MVDMSLLFAYSFRFLENIITNTRDAIYRSNDRKESGFTGEIFATDTNSNPRRPPVIPFAACVPTR